MLPRESVMFITVIPESSFTLKIILIKCLFLPTRNTFYIWTSKLWDFLSPVSSFTCKLGPGHHGYQDDHQPWTQWHCVIRSEGTSGCLFINPVLTWTLLYIIFQLFFLLFFIFARHISLQIFFSSNTFGFVSRQFWCLLTTIPTLSNVKRCQQLWLRGGGQIDSSLGLSLELQT